ncbi:hypothetical protein OIDMADRAFT_136641, partial [Oidiodendron maius Zn]
WKGIDYNPIFYNAESFKGALYKIKAFYNQYPKAIGPLVNLKYWLDCYKQGKEPENYLNNNAYTDIC